MTSPLAIIESLDWDRMKLCVNDEGTALIAPELKEWGEGTFMPPLVAPMTKVAQFINERFNQENLAGISHNKLSKLCYKTLVLSNYGHKNNIDTKELDTISIKLIKYLYNSKFSPGRDNISDTEMQHFIDRTSAQNITEEYHTFRTTMSYLQGTVERIPLKYAELGLPSNVAAKIASIILINPNVDPIRSNVLADLLAGGFDPTVMANHLKFLINVNKNSHKEFLFTFLPSPQDTATWTEWESILAPFEYLNEDEIYNRLVPFVSHAGDVPLASRLALGRYYFTNVNKELLPYIVIETFLQTLNQ